MKKIVLMLSVFVLGLALVFGGVINTHQTSAISALSYGETTENKIYCTATIKDDFSDNTVLVVLNREASLSGLKDSKDFREYTPKDFSEIRLSGVEDLTRTTVDVVKRQIADEKLLSEKQVATEQFLDNKSMKVDVENFKRILKLDLREKGKENVLNVIKQLEKRDDILSANPDFLHTLSAIYPTEWSSLNSTQRWGLEQIGLPNAWDLVSHTPSVIVGVIDSGIDATHPDLVNQVNVAMSRDYVGGTPTASGMKHATHVAGTIGATGNNGFGAVGVSWDVKLVSMRVFDNNGNGYTYNVVNAVNYAILVGIPILNYSGGGYTFDTTLRAAISNYPGFFAAASGNEANNNDNTPHYPSNFVNDRLISVGATTATDTMASFSNWGATSVDIFAPGVNIWNTIPAEIGSYGYLQGTSMATPYVAGVAALLKSRAPSLSGAAIKNAIMDNVDVVSSLSGLCVSGGRLNAYKVLNATQLKVGTYNISTVAGTEIALSNDNSTSFDVTLTTNNGATRTFTFAADSSLGYASTKTWSPIWTNLNTWHNFFNEVNIKFVSNTLFTVYCQGVMLDSFSDSNGFASMRINVTATSGKSVITSPSGSISHVAQTPTYISTAQQLSNIRNNPNGWYVLSNDIDLSSFGQWTSIPQLGPNGILDGNGKTVTGLTINGYGVGSTTANVGLIEYNRGLIMNLKMANLYIYLPNDQRAVMSNVGAVVGFNEQGGVVRNVEVEYGEIRVYRNYSSLGGIVGRNHGMISNSDFISGLLVGYGDMGGITSVNMYEGSVIQCDLYYTVMHYVYDSANRSVGGIVGYNYSARIESCNAYYSQINYSNTGVASDNRVPFIGIIVGLLDNNSQLWYVGQSNVTLNPGTLTAAQRVNFGATRWWQWGGNEWGTNDIR